MANENLANPTPGGASALENWFPTATGLRVRAGNELYATLVGGDAPVTALFGYLNGDNERLFAANATTIFDITTVLAPDELVIVTDGDDEIATEGGDTLGSGSTDGLQVVEGTAGGNWIAVQFATAGGVFLVGVNGADDAFVFDGDAFYRLNGTATYRLDYEVETAPFTVGSTLTGTTSGGTATIQRVVDQGTTGSLFLRNLAGPAFQDGEEITDAAGGDALADGTAQIAFGAFLGVETPDLSYVWVYKQRLWFVEKDSLNAWYLPTDQVAGTAVEFPLGGVFGRGGSLLFGATWSLDSGASGGLSEQCIFVSTEGEVAVYQGSDPSSASAWSKVGVYRIGRPLGPNAWMRAGGDIVIATDIGFIPLSQAIQKAEAALSPAAVSYLIEDAWNERVAARGSTPWHCELWPTHQMAVIALPTIEDARPEMLVVNARTGAWTLYTGWDGTCLRVFKGRLFFGSSDGRVVEAEVSGSDQNKPYTALCVPLFSDLGQPGTFKTAGMARAVLLSPFPVEERISTQKDFILDVPPAPNAPSVASASVWRLGIWGVSTWGVGLAKKTSQQWRSVGGTGYTLAPSLQITSGAIPPPLVELVRMEITYQSADAGP